MTIKKGTNIGPRGKFSFRNIPKNPVKMENSKNTIKIENSKQKVRID